MGYYSSTETEDITLRGYDEITGAPKIIVRLPKWKLIPTEKMHIYQMALTKLHHEAETRRRICLMEGNGDGYIRGKNKRDF